MKYNEQDMARLISEVENEFKEYLTKAEQSVSSNENTEESTACVENNEEVSLEKTETEVEFDYDEEDIKEMNEMYSSMSKSEKEAHYSAIKSALFGESEESEESEDLNKSEETKAADEEKELLKSEVDSVKKENEELKKNIETLTSIVSKIVKKAPTRKAITQIGNVQVIKKSEDMTEKKDEVDYSSMKKSEINKILSKKIRNGEIKKAEDKEKVNQFCYGQIKIDEIKHLLK